MLEFFWPGGSKAGRPAPQAPAEPVGEQPPARIDGDRQESASEKTQPPPQSNSCPNFEQARVENSTLPPLATDRAGAALPAAIASTASAPLASEAGSGGVLMPDLADSRDTPLPCLLAGRRRGR